MTVAPNQSDLLPVRLDRLLGPTTPPRWGATPLARKRRAMHLHRALEAELGIEHPTLAQRVLLASLVTLTLRSAEVRDAVYRGEQVDRDEVIKLSSEARRLTKLLGLDAKPEREEAAR
jgi:hypothetical protein